MANPAHASIDQLVKSEKIVLFMKGNRSFPQCGFSATVVQILDGILPEYRTVNVLDDPDIRQGIKDYSNWPTIPQLYVDGEFVGGCDIVKQMHGQGELAKMLGVDLGNVEPPSIKLSDSAKAELQAALSDAGPEEKVHVHVSASFEHSLSLGPVGANMLTVDANGVTLVFDAWSAKRADGLAIDFQTGPDGAGFKIENPNAPPKIEQLSPKELLAKLKAKEIAEFVDVRTPDEHAAAKIPEATFMDEATRARLEGLPKDTPIAFHCRSGKRSQKAAEAFRAKGFTKLFNLAGGIHAWSDDIDPSIPKA